LTVTSTHGYNQLFLKFGQTSACADRSGKEAVILYAIIQSGGKQYRVSEGATVEVERLDGEVGQELEFPEVLFVSGDDEVQAGTPSVNGARVVGIIVAQKKGKKVLVFKFKRRKMYRKLTGHRQSITGIKISKIEINPRTDEE
jgi:large subunit ribosomal protein L21